MTIMPALLGSPEVQLLTKLGIRAREPVPSISFFVWLFLLGWNKKIDLQIHPKPADHCPAVPTLEL
jgi:hypothetical protein